MKSRSFLKPMVVFLLVLASLLIVRACSQTKPRRESRVSNQPKGTPFCGALSCKERSRSIRHRSEA